MAGLDGSPLHGKSQTYTNREAAGPALRLGGAGAGPRDANGGRSGGHPGRPAVESVLWSRELVALSSQGFR
jgi:hypothetical protein